MSDGITCAKRPVLKDGKRSLDKFAHTIPRSRQAGIFAANSRAWLAVWQGDWREAIVRSEIGNLINEVLALSRMWTSIKAVLDDGPAGRRSQRPGRAS
jgi:hypothetical protein